jgi:hypothetical protein
VAFAQRLSVSSELDLNRFNMPNQIFLLSPASCAGRRAEILFREQASFDLANRLRTGAGATLGEAFSFLSGLYFRGKLAYASRFGRAEQGLPQALVITAGRGLLSPETRMDIQDLQAFATVSIDLSEPRYRQPLHQHAMRLACQLGSQCRVVLLGSIATAKYSDVLIEALGDRLWFPADFVGRGDLSRGGLMLRAVAAGQELEYMQLAGANFRGKRPAQLPPKRPTATN